MNVCSQIMADLENTSGENATSGGGTENVKSTTNVQQTLLISCMQKIVIYETKAVRLQSSFKQFSCNSERTLIQQPFQAIELLLY